MNFFIQIHGIVCTEYLAYLDYFFCDVHFKKPHAKRNYQRANHHEEQLRLLKKASKMTLKTESMLEEEHQESIK